MDVTDGELRQRTIDHNLLGDGLVLPANARPLPAGSPDHLALSLEPDAPAHAIRG